MALSWVILRCMRDCELFVDRKFGNAAGRTNTPFKVQMGQKTFSTLTDDDPRRIDCEVKEVVRLAHDDDPQIIELPPPGSGPI